MPVRNAAVQTCIDRKKTAVGPDAAEQVAAGAKIAAGGKCHENMYAN